MRKSGDWLYFALKQFDLIEQQGEQVPDVWRNSLRRLADPFVKLWETYGQFGQFVDVVTGELLIGGSSSGSVVPGALALATDYFDNPQYLKVAEASATYYHENYVRKGIFTGGPGEILSAPDSEAAFAIVESFVALLERTGKECWAQAARDAVRQASTWVVAYDYAFP